MKTNALADLLRAIADLVEAPDPQSLQRLTSQLSQAKAVSSRASKKRTKTDDARQAKMVLIRDRLLDSKTREDGYKILQESDLSQKEMLAIAKSAQVHVSRSDNIEAIKERLVETIVGSQLNARAIRGYD